MTSPDDKTVIVSQPGASATRPANVDTAVAGNPAVMPSSAANVESHHALAIGARVADFEIKGLIGEGGFGIVYLAYDTQLGRNVALKEYMPAALASRGANDEVTVRSGRHEETFRAGMKSFVNEARLLAQFDHPSLVKVYRFWEANGTAYMVMPYYEGLTLRDTLRTMSSPPDEAGLRALLGPLLSALGVMHAAQCFHRDIAPDNILLLKGSGRPLLLDFGAARRVIGDMTQALTVILKPGYAPVEQYAEVPSLKQGPWTDLYAVAAVVYFAILGKTPPPSVGRMMSDSYVPLAKQAVGRYTPAFLQAIDHALAVRPDERPQSVHVFAAELGLPLGDQDDADAPSLAMTRGNAGVRDAGDSAPGLRGDSKAGGPKASVRSATDGAPREANRRSISIAASAVVIAGLAALGGWLALRPAGTPSPSADARATVAPNGNAPNGIAASNGLAASSAPARAQSASVTAASAPLASAAPPPSTATSTANVNPAANTGATAARQAATALPPYSPDGELERIAALADPSIRVTAASRNTTARINKDRLQFTVSSNRAGYVYVFMVDPAGQYLMLFPNGLDKNNTINAGESLSLPRASWPMTAGAPAGPNHFLVLVSPARRDFSDGGLHRGTVFADFPEMAQRTAAARRTGSYSPFAGQARCTAGAADCKDTFGAATFTIDVIGPST
ncbi:serine/threonine-protein kinase [Paraburkholderia sp. LEh10]|uniref:serine/threonine-protein kinase n=1 Tax=Paraburkholderia sp. LEh10 TaxID=2821353 RepID=UPI001FD8326F|nr:serine/threonine-protein kinase [Paraburkholderia sp. LEh10]